VIIIANDVGSKELAPYFTRRGVETSVEEMDFSDFAFEGYVTGGNKGVIGVERKTVGDLITCMNDGRFADHQLRGMLTNFDECYLLVEGVYNEVTDGSVVYWCNGREKYTRVSYKHLDKFLLTVTRQAGFRILKTSGKEQTASAVINLYEHTQKPLDEHQSLNKFRTDATVVHTLTTKHSLLRRWAKELPGVGWEKSLAIERTFRTPINLVNATRKDISSIVWKGRKIGDKAAERIYLAIREG
jgi:ERCC4-type nuclease